MRGRLSPFLFPKKEKKGKRREKGKKKGAAEMTAILIYVPEKRKERGKKEGKGKPAERFLQHG